MDFEIKDQKINSFEEMNDSIFTSLEEMN